MRLAFLIFGGFFRLNSRDRNTGPGRRTNRRQITKCAVKKLSAAEGWIKPSNRWFLLRETSAHTYFCVHVKRNPHHRKPSGRQPRCDKNLILAHRVYRSLAW